MLLVPKRGKRNLMSVMYSNHVKADKSQLDALYDLLIRTVDAEDASLMYSEISSL